MRFDFEPSSRYRFVVLYDPAALPANLPLDQDLEAQDPTPPPHNSVRALTKEGRAFVVEVPTEEDCEATIRVFVDEQPPEVIKKAKIVGREMLIQIPGGTLRADGSEFMCFPGMTRKEGNEDPAMNLPAGNYLMTIHELVHWKLRNRTKELRALSTPLIRFMDVIGQTMGILGAILAVGHILVLPAVLWAVWSKHGWKSAGKFALIVFAIDVFLIGCIVLYGWLEKKISHNSGMAEIRNKFDAEHPDFIVTLQSANGQASSGDIPLFKWPDA